MFLLHTLRRASRLTPRRSPPKTLHFKSIRLSSTLQTQPPGPSTPKPLPTEPSKDVDWQTYYTIVGPDIINEYIDLVKRGYDASWETWLRIRDLRRNSSSREYQLVQRTTGDSPTLDLVNRGKGRDRERPYLRDFLKGNEMPYGKWLKGSPRNHTQIEEKPADEPAPKAWTTRLGHIGSLSPVAPNEPISSEDEWQWLDAKKETSTQKSIMLTRVVYHEIEGLGRSRFTVDCSGADWLEGETRRVRPFYDNGYKAVRFMTEEGKVLPNAYFLDQLSSHLGLRPLLQLGVKEGTISPDDLPVKTHIPSLDLQTNLDNKFYPGTIIEPHQYLPLPSGESTVKKLYFSLLLSNETLFKAVVPRLAVDPSNSAIRRMPDGRMRLEIVPYIHPITQALRFYEVNSAEDLTFISHWQTHVREHLAPEVESRWPVLYKWAKDLGYWPDKK